MYGQGYGGYGYSPGGINDWCEVDVINCTKIRHENIMCVAFDSTEELLWNGNDSGRVQSHIPPSLGLHSAFYAHTAKPNSTSNQVRAIQPLANAVLTLGEDGFRIFSKGGALRYSSSHPSLFGLSAMSFNPTTNQMSFAGGQGRRSVISNFDLTSGSITEENYFDNGDKTIAIIKHTPRKICCALSDGQIQVHDPRSLEIITSYQSHHGIFDMDIKNETIVTCGPSMMYDQILPDPHIKIFDLRMQQFLNPIEIKSGAFMLKFHPKLSSTLFVVSQGFFQICDTQAGSIAIPQCYQLNTHNLIGFDISSSADIMCFSNEIEIRQWVQKQTVVVNDFSTPLEEVPGPPIPSPNRIDDKTPLNMMTEPLKEGDTFLSDWPNEKYQVNLIPVPVDLKLLEHPSQKNKSFNVMPNKTRHPRNQALTASARFTKNLLSKAETSFARLTKGMRKPPEKYRKNLFPIKQADFNISSHNRSLFTGLDNTFMDCYINPIVQTLFFCTPIRESLLQHLCNEEYCLSCELGFLFYSMELMQGKCAANTNLLRTLQNIPDAGRRNFLQYRSKTSLYSSLLSDSLDFLLDQIRRELRMNICHPILGRIQPETNTIDETFLSSFTKYSRCQYCSNVISFVQQRGTFKLQHPFGNSNPPTFRELLFRSMCQELNEEIHCKQCERAHIMRTSSRPLELSPVIVIHTNIQTSSQLEAWIPPTTGENYVPQNLHFNISNDNFSIDEIGNNAVDEIKNSYKLVGVICQVIDCKTPVYESPTHFVSHVNVPSLYARSFSKTNEDGTVETKRGCGWMLFNDFTIAEESVDDVLKFAEWKVPVALIYHRSSNLQSYRNAHPAKDVKIPDEIFFVENPLEMSRFHPVPDGTRVSQEDELPKSGDLLPIDTEFVSLSPPQRATRRDGRIIEYRPSRSSLARVSILKCNEDSGNSLVLLDEHIVTRQPIADYLTRFSGIVAGDLDPCTSKYHVVTLKSMYMKLRILVARGCIFVGHGLRKDFWICNLFVPDSQIRDTVHLFKLPYERMISLRYLAFHLLGLDIQGITHDSIEDAETALQLYYKYKELQENGTFTQTLKSIYEKGRASNWKVQDKEETADEQLATVSDDSFQFA